LRPFYFNERIDMAHNELQGNAPEMDPSVYGLKFDGGKDRWELLPPELFQWLAFAVTIREDKFFTFDKKMLVDEFYDLAFSWRSKGSTDQFDKLAEMATIIIRILKGRPLTAEETRGSRSGSLIIEDVSKVVSIYSYGAKKYQDHNWMKVSPDRYFAAMMRHFNTINTKSRYDDESGFLHLHHALWNVMALKWFELYNNQQKDESNEARVHQAGCDRCDCKDPQDRPGKHQTVGRVSGRPGDSGRGSGQARRKARPSGKEG